MRIKARQNAFAHCSLKPPIEPEVSTQTINGPRGCSSNLYVPPDVRSLFAPRLTVQAIGEQLFFHQPTVKLILQFRYSLVSPVLAVGRRKYHRFVVDRPPAPERWTARAPWYERFPSAHRFVELTWLPENAPAVLPGVHQFRLLCQKFTVLHNQLIVATF